MERAIFIYKCNADHHLWALRINGYILQWSLRKDWAKGAKYCGGGRNRSHHHSATSVTFAKTYSTPPTASRHKTTLRDSRTPLTSLKLSALTLSTTKPQLDFIVELEPHHQLNPTPPASQLPEVKEIVHPPPPPPVTPRRRDARDIVLDPTTEAVNTTVVNNYSPFEYYNPIRFPCASGFVDMPVNVATSSEPGNVPPLVTRVDDGPHLFIKKLGPNAKLPTRGSAFAAGYDLYASKETVILARGKALVDTDLAMAVPAGTYGRIAPRSGLAAKNFIDTGAGVIDADYRGQVKVLLFNHSDVDFEVKMHDRVAQLVLERIYTPEVREIDELVESVRGEGGFGSTGVSIGSTGKTVAQGLAIP